MDDERGECVMPRGGIMEGNIGEEEVARNEVWIDDFKSQVSSAMCM